MGPFPNILQSFDKALDSLRGGPLQLTKEDREIESLDRQAEHLRDHRDRLEARLHSRLVAIDKEIEAIDDKRFALQDARREAFMGRGL